jgi:cysteine desulfurase
MDKNAPLYLDYNATAPLLPEVRSAMAEALALTGNPSSIHGAGRNARKHVEHAREQIAKLVNCDPTHVTFTSGATESNNWVLFGAPVKRILVSAIEHPSLLDAAKEKNNVDIIPVTKDGVIDTAALDKMLAQSDEKTLVCTMWVNNETGVIQPIAQIAETCAKHGALLHVDAVQAAGRLPIDLKKIKIDYLALSAHKMGGPAGIGALIYDHDTTLAKFIHGGGQERRRRAGTENTLGIIGFGIASEVAQGTQKNYAKLGQWRDTMETHLKSALPGLVIVGENAPRVGNTSQIILPGVTSEKQLMALDLAGVHVSSGSACSSGSVKPSHVLLAMGIPESMAACAIRVSTGPFSCEKDLQSFGKALLSLGLQKRHA